MQYQMEAYSAHILAVIWHGDLAEAKLAIPHFLFCSLVVKFIQLVVVFLYRENMPQTVTSVRVDEELWKKAKIHAIRKGITLTALLEELLRNELEKEVPTK